MTSPKEPRPGVDREALARVAFAELCPWESWDGFDERREARGGHLHPMQAKALAVVDAILAALPESGDLHAE